jgi:hypothetical protein
MLSGDSADTTCEVTSMLVTVMKGEEIYYSCNLLTNAIVLLTISLATNSSSVICLKFSLGMQILFNSCTILSSFLYTAMSLSLSPLDMSW